MSDRDRLRDDSDNCEVRGDHRNAFEIAEDFEAVYGLKPGLRRMGSLQDLYGLMHKTREEQPGNIWAWLAMF